MPQNILIEMHSTQVILYIGMLCVRFIINCLKKNGDTPESLISKALTHEPNKSITFHNEIEATEAIDIRDFSKLMITYWKNTVSFSEKFDLDSKVRTDTETIKKGRKLWAHPGLEDANPGETQTLLSLISKVLGEINEPDEKRKVEAILNQLFPFDSESNLEKVSEELTTLKKHQEATDERLAVVEEHCANIADTLNQLRTALVKPLEATEQFTNELHQPVEVEKLDYEESRSDNSSLESSRLQNSMEVSNILEVGQCLQGSVDQIIDAGVYVKLDKNRGFIRQSELTLKTINHPSDVVQMNEKVEIIVINPNQGNDGQLPTLRLKSKHDEWVNRIKEKYQENSKHQGTVTNVDSEHGTFVEFEKGITGLIHHSNMQGFGVPQKDEEINVIISRINYEEERLALSLL